MISETRTVLGALVIQGFLSLNTPRSPMQVRKLGDFLPSVASNYHYSPVPTPVMARVCPDSASHPTHVSFYILRSPFDYCE